mgnify:CR=1 FL=1
MEFADGEPVLPPGYAATLERALADVADKTNARLRFVGDCDTAIIKGVVGLLVELFSGLRPQQVMELDVDRLFERIRLGEHLSPNRRVGVYAIVDQMKAQAERLAGAPVAA